MQLSGFNKFIVFFILTFVVIGLLIFAVALPMIGKIEQMSQEYLSNEEAINRLYNRDVVVSSLSSEAEKVKDKINQIDGAFLRPDKLASFIEDLEKIAVITNNQIEIQTAVSNASASSVDNSQAENNINNVMFQVTLTGSFNNLVKYLANLENIPSPPYRLIEISDLRINQIEQSTGPILKSVINLKVYTQ